MGNVCCMGRGGYVSEQPRGEELAGVLPNPAADHSQPAADVAETALECTETSTQTGGTNDRDNLEMLLIREVLRCNSVVLKDVYSVRSITAKLVANGVLAEEEQTAILSQDSDAGQNGKLLHYVSHKSPETFYSFCHTIHSESEKGAKVIQYLAGELHSLDTNIAFADKMEVQASRIPLQLQQEGALLAETLIDRDMWENLCYRTKAKQVMVAKNTQDVQWALVSALQEAIRDISTGIASMRESCLKMQQAIEASEGPDTDPGSSDLKEEVNHALKLCNEGEARCSESMSALGSKATAALDLRAQLTAVCKERDLCKQKVDELAKGCSEQNMLTQLKFKMSRMLQRKVQYVGVCKGSLQFPSEPGKLWGLAVSPTGVLYVGDWDNHCIHVFDADRKYMRCIGKQELGNRAFTKPRGIAISEEGQLFVANSNRIDVIGDDGSFVRHFGESELENPKSLAIDGSSGKVYVTDYDNHCICVFSQDGALIQKFGVKGSNSGEFQFPLDLCISVNSHLYVTDTQNHRIQVFTLQGEYLREFSTGQQSNPFGVLVLADATVLTFVHEKQISAYNDKGEAIHTFGQRGKEEGCFKDARVLAVDHNGDLLISEWKNKRVQIF